MNTDVVHFCQNKMFTSVRLCGIQEPGSPISYGTFDWGEVTCPDCISIAKNTKPRCAVCGEYPASYADLKSHYASVHPDFETGWFKP